jgi:hypothetical protein
MSQFMGLLRKHNTTFRKLYQLKAYFSTLGLHVLSSYSYKFYFKYYCIMLHWLVW